MQQRREDSLRGQVFYGEITVSRGEPLGVARDPLPERRIRIRNLPKSRNESSLGKYRTICRVTPGNG